MRSVIHEEHMHSICKQCLLSHYIYAPFLNVTVSGASLTVQFCWGSDEAWVRELYKFICT